MLNSFFKNAHEGANDIRASFERINIVWVFGWQDVAQRYRRSKIGAFWLTINKLVLIAALATIFGSLFRMELKEFLPFIATGIIFWGFISNSLNEGCTSFTAAEGIILQVQMPLFVHVLRSLWRNTIILAHDLLIYPLVLAAFTLNPGWSFFLVIPGFILLALNLAWISLLFGTICARYRDMPLIIVNILQVAFYATPLMWKPESLPEGAISYLLLLNPFYHLVSLVRDPLLGSAPALASWVLCLSMALLGWVITLGFYGRYRWRIPYWL